MLVVKMISRKIALRNIPISEFNRVAMKKIKLHHRKLRFIEFVRIAYPNTFTAALLWFPIKLGLLKWQPMIIPRRESLADESVPFESLPQTAQSHLKAYLPHLAETGYLDPLFECTKSSGSVGEIIVGVAIRVRHTSGTHVRQTIFSYSEQVTSRIQTNLITFHSDSSTTATTDSRQTFDRIPGASASYHPGKNFEELLKIHDRKLNFSTRPIVKINDNADLIREEDALSKRYFSHMIHRGVMTEVLE